MVRRFLKYGKPLSLTRQPADVRKLLDEVLDVAAQRATAENIEVKRDYATGLPGVWVDVPHLKTCFMNLVLNAFQAMPGGGELRVSALAHPGRGDRGPGASVPLPIPDSPPLAPEGRVEILFEDTGTGIKPEDLPKVFEPYFTTKEVGIGLGLAMTKQIIEEHGGRIEISSEPGQGTLVRLQLPVRVSEA
jgi:signal transduction histidine kinase